MKILYVSQYYPPETGAPAVRVSELARAWVADGHEVTVLTGFPHHPTGVVPEGYRGWPWVRTEDDAGVRVVRVPVFASANKGVVKRSLSYLSFAASAGLLGPVLAGRPDVVVATSPQFLTGMAGLELAFLKRVPFVFEVRDLWPQSVVEVGAMAADHPAVKAMEVAERLLYARADRIVVVSEPFVDELAARGVDPSKTFVVTNGVDLDRFRPMPRENDIRSELGLTGKFVAMYVGTHGMAHGLATLLEAAELMRGDDRFRFVFVGEGADKEALVERARRRALGNVVFVGQQPHERIPEFVSAADAMLVPLRAKALFRTVLPSKIFECLAAARPVVLGVEGEARRLVEASGGGVCVPPESAEAIVSVLRHLEADRPGAEAMGRRGRAYVEQHFARPVLARRYLGLLAEVAGKGPVEARDVRVSEVRDDPAAA
jgi:colanic acid biosynthesis glycosyl transferase WcaI